jgi:hypothetical protein
MGQRSNDHDSRAALNIPDVVGSPPDVAAIWTVKEVSLRLEDAGRTLMSLPLPRGSLPKDERSRWPEAVRGYEDAFAALIGASYDVKQDFSDGHNRVRAAPSARSVGQMEEALDWLWHFDDPRKRRLCLARALLHPVSGRHIASYRKLGRIFGLHHETLRAWHDRALAELATVLTRDRIPKNGRMRKLRARAPTAGGARRNQAPP